MAKKKRKWSSRPPVSLPPFPWDQTGRDALGTIAALARPGVAEADIQEPAGMGKDGDLIARRARVWMVEMPAALRHLPPADQAALIDYAEAVAMVGSAKGQDFASAGGGGGGKPSGGPALAALAAAERARRAVALLDGRALTIVPYDVRPRDRRPHVVSYADLVDWVAVDGLNAAGVARRMGLAAVEGGRLAAVRAAISEMAALVAVALGHRQAGAA